MDSDLYCLQSNEEEWVSVVTKAIQVREDNLSLLKKDLNTKVELLSEKDKEIAELKEYIIELKTSLDNECKKYQDAKSYYEEELTRQKHDMLLKLETAVDEKKQMLDSEVEMLRVKHSVTIKQLLRGMKKELEELESQLDREKSHLNEKNMECGHLQEELMNKKQLLDDLNTKFVVKEKEVIHLQNNCDNLFCERKKIIERLKFLVNKNDKIVTENIDLKNKNIAINKETLEKLEFMMNTLNSNQGKERALLTKIQQIADEKLKSTSDIRNREYEKAIKCCDVSSQTEELDNKIVLELTSQLSIKKSKEEMLEHKIKCSEKELGDVKKQNTMLKEVIKDMKKEREQKNRQIKEEDDEARVKRLEEKVKLLKNRCIENGVNSNIWLALSRFKEELNDLKGGGNSIK